MRKRGFLQPLQSGGKVRSSTTRGKPKDLAEMLPTPLTCRPDRVMKCEMEHPNVAVRGLIPWTVVNVCYLGPPPETP